MPDGKPCSQSLGELHGCAEAFCASRIAQPAAEVNKTMTAKTIHNAAQPIRCRLHFFITLSEQFWGLVKDSITNLDVALLPVGENVGDALVFV